MSKSGKSSKSSARSKRNVCKDYTPRIGGTRPDHADGFQIMDVTYFGKPPADTPIEYDIVKWEQCEPFEAYSLRDGKRHTYTEHCYSVGRLEWNDREPCFEFSSIGLRWLEANPPQEVVDMILKFAEEKAKELTDLDSGGSWFDE